MIYTIYSFVAQIFDFDISNVIVFLYDSSSVSDSNRIWTHNHLLCKWTLNHLTKLALNGWVFVYNLSGCGFKSRCCHLNSRYHAFFEQVAPWHSGNYRVQIHCESHRWHDNNILTFYLSWFYLVQHFLHR